MLTFLQWQNTRRVDHAKIPFHPRFRAHDPNRRPDLKTFDKLVQDYNAPGIKKLDQVIILGNILDRAGEFLRSNKYEPDRYLQAVRTLRTAAIEELSGKFPEKGFAIGDDIERAAKKQPLTPKIIPINVYYLDNVAAKLDRKEMDKIIDQQIDTANNSQAFQNAEIKIIRKNRQATLISQTPDRKPILESNGKLQEERNGGSRLIEALNAEHHAGMDVVFLQEYDSPDVQGFTFQPSKAYESNFSSKGPSNCISPARPIVTMRTTPAAGLESTHSTTLLHEICHAVSGNGEHSPDRDNLMAAGTDRKDGSVKNDLSVGQIGWYRNNDWVYDKK